MSDVTVLLQAARSGDARAMDDLLPLVYDALRNLAKARMARESEEHTLQPTALVHEAWLRLVGDQDRTWENRAHFFGAAAEAMRRILIEHARRRSRLRHGGGLERLNIADLEVAASTEDDKILLVNEALKELETEHPEQARVVVLRFFGGMTNQEVAETMGIGERTVDRHWVCAKTWLFCRISG